MSLPFQFGTTPRFLPHLFGCPSKPSYHPSSSLMSAQLLFSLLSQTNSHQNSQYHQARVSSLPISSLPFISMLLETMSALWYPNFSALTTSQVWLFLRFLLSVTETWTGRQTHSSPWAWWHSQEIFKSNHKVWNRMKCTWIYMFTVRIMSIMPRL